MKRFILSKIVLFLAITSCVPCLAPVARKPQTAKPIAQPSQNKLAPQASMPAPSYAIPGQDSTPAAQPQAPTMQPSPTSATPTQNTSRSSTQPTYVPTTATSDEPDLFSETSTSTTPAAATPAASAEDAGMPIELPVIGTVTLLPFEENGESGMRVYMPAKGKSLNWGPLIIDDGQFRQIGDKLQYLARAKFFGKTVKLGIKDVALGQSAGTKKTYDKLTLGMDFDKDDLPTLELIPGKQAKLSTVDIILEKTKPIQLVGSSTILGQPAQIIFSIDKGATDAWTELKNVPLKEVISQAVGTPLQNAMLTTFKVTIKNLTSKTNVPKQLLIDGKADLSTTPGLDQSREVKEVNVSITANAKEQKFQADTQQLTIPAFGTIQNAKIIGNFTDAKKEVTLDGSSSVDFPGVGTFDTKLNAIVNNDGIDFSSQLQQTVSFAGIDIKNVMLKFSTAKKTLALQGLGNIRGYVANVEVIKDIKDMVSVEASLKEKKIKPFTTTNVPVIKDLTLLDPGFRFVKKDKDFEAIMHGNVTVFGVPLTGDLYLKKASDGQTVSLLEVTAPKNWKLSQGVPELAGTIFDEIELIDLIFIFSSNDYNDTDRQMTFRKGFNFISKTKLTGALVPVATLTDTPKDSLISLQGYVATGNPLDSVFKASIPTGVVLKQDNVTLGKLELEIAGSPTPAFALLTIMIIKPSPEDNPLTFTTRIKFATPTFLFAGTMAGKWVNPLGIKGFEIGSDDPNIPVQGVAAEMGIDMPTFPATHLPSSLGLAGALTIGTRHVAMAIKLPIAGAGDLVLYGELDKLSLNDLADAAKKVVGNPLQVEKMPDVSIEQMKVYIVPKTTTIGEFNFNRGLTLRGKINIPGFSAYGNFNLSGDGIVAEAMCTEIKYGPLLISRKAHQTIDSQFPEYNGPLMHLGLTLFEQQIMLSGLLKLADIFEDETAVRISRDEIFFDFESAIGKTMYNGKPLLYSHIQGQSSGNLSNPQFAMSIDFEDNFQAYLLEQVKEGIKAAKIEVTEKVNKAIDDVQRARALDPAEVAKQVNKAKQDVENAKQKLASIDQAIAEAEKKLSDPQQKVRSLQAQIDDMQKKIDNSKAYCNNAEWFRKVDKCIQAGGEITGFGIALAGLVTAKETADKFLEGLKQTATGVLRASRAVAQKTLETSQAFLEEVGKPIATTGATAVRETGKGVLVGAREVATGTLTGSEKTAEFLLTAYDIQKRHWNGSIQDLAKGNLGNMQVSGKIFNQSFDVKMDLDIHKPYNAIKDAANKMVDMLKDAIEKMK